MAEGIGLPEPAATDKTFGRRVALATAIIAVVMAFSSLGRSNSTKEKKEIEPEARKLEAQRDVAAAKDQNFDYAGVLFQIAIVLGSVAILSESRPVLVACLVFGVLAALLGANGFLLLVKLPF